VNKPLLVSHPDLCGSSENDPVLGAVVVESRRHLLAYPHHQLSDPVSLPLFKIPVNAEGRGLNPAANCSPLTLFLEKGDQIPDLLNIFLVQNQNSVLCADHDLVFQPDSGYQAPSLRDEEIVPAPYQLHLSKANVSPFVLGQVLIN